MNRSQSFRWYFASLVLLSAVSEGTVVNISRGNTTFYANDKFFKVNGGASTNSGTKFQNIGVNFPAASGPSQLTAFSNTGGVLSGGDHGVVISNATGSGPYNGAINLSSSSISYVASNPTITVCNDTAFEVTYDLARTPACSVGSPCNRQTVSTFAAPSGSTACDSVGGSNFTSITSNGTISPLISASSPEEGNYFIYCARIQADTTSNTTGARSSWVKFTMDDTGTHCTASIEASRRKY